MKILKVTASSGVYLTKNPDNKPYGEGVKSYEFIEMTEEEYQSIPQTEEAKRFFEGKLVAQRAD